MRFAFIDAEKANFPVTALCRNLEVTRQGYYASAKRQQSARSASNAALLERVQEVYAQSERRYGSLKLPQFR